VSDAQTRRAASLRAFAVLAGLCAGPGLTGCTPTVQVKAPEEPITINLNIKLDADVRVRLEEKAKQDVETKPIF
jgi:hypothetical protein